MNASLPPKITELDACGLLCPLPVLKIRKALAPLAKGQVLQVLADDPAAQIDVAHFCAEQGHILQNVEKKENFFIFLIKKQ